MSNYNIGGGVPLGGFFDFSGLGSLEFSPLPTDTDMGVNVDEFDPNAPQAMVNDPTKPSTTFPTATSPPQTFVPPKPPTGTTTTAVNTNNNPPAEVKTTFFEQMQKYFKENQKAILITLGVLGAAGTAYVVHQQANKGLNGLGKSSKTLRGIKKEQFNKKYS